LLKYNTKNLYVYKSKKLVFYLVRGIRIWTTKTFLPKYGRGHTAVASLFASSSHSFRGFALLYEKFHFFFIGGVQHSGVFGGDAIFRKSLKKLFVATFKHINFRVSQGWVVCSVSGSIFFSEKKENIN